MERKRDLTRSLSEICKTASVKVKSFIAVSEAKSRKPARRENQKRLKIDKLGKLEVQCNVFNIQMK